MNRRHFQGLNSSALLRLDKACNLGGSCFDGSVKEAERTRNGVASTLYFSVGVEYADEECEDGYDDVNIY